MKYQDTCPMPATEVLDQYFLHNRAAVLDVAAFLDRIDRARDPQTARSDPRYAALIEALETVVQGADGQRARAVQICLSDPTTEPLESAAGLKGALGAWPGARQGGDR